MSGERLHDFAPDEVMRLRAEVSAEVERRVAEAGVPLSYDLSSDQTRSVGEAVEASRSSAARRWSLTRADVEDAVDSGTYDEDGERRYGWMGQE